eukprot:885894-Amphidinium_carterae.1
MPTIRERQIQKNHTSDVLCELYLGDTLHKIEERNAPLGLAHTPPRGRDNRKSRHIYETEEDDEDNMLRRKQTSLSV